MWCGEADLTPETPYTVDLVEVALSTKAVHVVWSQSVAPSPSTFRIFYRRGRFITTSVTEDKGAHPERAILGQNYPNPFNSTTTIVWRVLSRESVSLSVYDVLGREVVALVSERKEPGKYTVAWNAEGMPNGVYYYRLIAGERIETKKAVLVR
jgi:hypothetical protein